LAGARTPPLWSLVAQGGLDQAPFRTLALVVLPLVLFLGIATFVRLVQVQRESVVYITGLNRIRHFFQESAPVSRPYFVLPANDDEAAMYRSIGAGNWQRSLATLRAAIRPIHPTPPGEMDAPF
jgi:hypothetical protein